jgi:hypothetical protein
MANGQYEAPPQISLANYGLGCSITPEYKLQGIADRCVNHVTFFRSYVILSCITRINFEMDLLNQYHTK